MIDDVDMIREFIKTQGMDCGATLKLSSNKEAELVYFIDGVAVYGMLDEHVAGFWYFATHFDSGQPQRTFIVERGSLLYDSSAVALVHPQKRFKISINAANGWSVDDVRRVLEDHNFSGIEIEED